MGASSPCPACGTSVLDIDVRCPACGQSLGSTGAQRMIGKLVLGQYEILELLGQGGMSVVYKGRHRITEQPVALKVLPPELAAHSQVKSRFVEEARALAQLDHPNIVHLYNFGEENGSFVLAMQLVAGKTWERLIFENKRLSWQNTTRIAVDVLRALEYAHGRGVIHRDMKASNVLVRAADGAATVMDFGIAKMTTSSRLTATGQTMGTVRYMSPEQVRGQDVDASTDLYSLGATIYESLTGETPFDGATHFEIMSKHLTEAPLPPSSHGVELPKGLEELVLRCLAKAPADRYSSARDLRKFFENVLREHDPGLVETQKVSRELLLDSAPSEAPASVATPSPSLDDARTAVPRLATELPSHEPKRRKTALAALFGALVLAAAGGMAALMLTRQEAPEVWEPKAANLTQNEPFLALGLDSVRTPPGLAPQQVAKAYGAALEAFTSYLAERSLPPPPRPVRSIVVVPQQVMCQPSTYQGVRIKESCENVPETFRAIDRVLVVVDDPQKLDDAMRLGISEAACAVGDDARLCEAASAFFSP